VVVTESGEEVANAVVSAPDRIGLPLHVLDENGDPKTSLGSFDDVALFRLDRSFLNTRRMTPGVANRVWAAPTNRYVIQEWDTDGERHTELVRDADWFPTWFERGFPATPDRKSPPYLRSIYRDGDECLWVAIFVPALDWAERLGPPVETPRGLRYDSSNPHLYDTIVECINTETHRLEFSQRVSPKIYGFLDQYHVYAYRWDEEGVPFIDVWRLRLQRP
jgi:hypothetical protein